MSRIIKWFQSWYWTWRVRRHPDFKPQRDEYLANIDEWVAEFVGEADE